ncbi:MAG: hypothetical protein DRO04_00425 [Candidatus Iainarchaeum archaeon]|uniref:KaiC-like domain-containing protein n=1 Tax=Candidatus Iainarchaeum sp. TaxID=3101447 RepID=A0A497JL37_9ARCH|nr:MAG: hypothetical protein DRO04_00425 [Candidatus Diapherotrites archaeon]
MVIDVFKFINASKEKKIVSGIPALDSMVGGGFNYGDLVLILGAPGTGKSTFVEQAFFANLKKGRRGIFAATNRVESSWLKELSSFGWDLSKFKDNFIFIDAYSAQATPGKISGEYTLSDVSDLNEFYRILKKAVAALDLKKTGGVIIIDSASDFLLYGNPTAVFRFMKLLSGLALENNAVAFITLEQGLHDEKITASMEYLCNVVLEFKVELNKRFMRIARFGAGVHPLEWIEFSIATTGLILNVEKFFGGGT